jgi:hypothetical protein
VRPANQLTITVVALCHKKFRNPRFSSSNIRCDLCGHKEYVLQNMTSIDTSGFCQKVFFFKLITGSCSKKGGGSLCSVGQQNRVCQTTRTSTDDLRAREELCNIISSSERRCACVRTVAKPVCSRVGINSLQRCKTTRQRNRSVRQLRAVLLHLL